VRLNKRFNNIAGVQRSALRDTFARSTSTPCHVAPANEIAMCLKRRPGESPALRRADEGRSSLSWRHYASQAWLRGDDGSGGLLTAHSASPGCRSLPRDIEVIRCTVGRPSLFARLRLTATICRRLAAHSVYALHTYSPAKNAGAGSRFGAQQ
jgi:hypothetical protein